MSNLNEVPVNEFGPVIFSYTRAQAIADGVLVDLTKLFPKLVQEAGIKLHLAMTSTAFVETVGPICSDEIKNGFREERLPDGQSYEGRLWDVLWMFKLAIRKSPFTDRCNFEVLVWNGKSHDTVKLWCLCGPGDDAEPVLTVMLEGED